MAALWRMCFKNINNRGESKHHKEKSRKFEARCLNASLYQSYEMLVFSSAM